VACCSPRVIVIGASGTDASAAPGGALMDASVDANVDADVSQGRYLEAESGALTGAFVIGDDAAASGGHFISPSAGEAAEDAPGPARAQYELFADQTGTYRVWGRIHAQNISENRFWIQVDDQGWYKWRITTGDVWFWDAFHDNVNYGTPILFPLSAGAHQLVIANCVDGPGLDRLYYAPDGSKPIGNDTTCNPPHSIDVGGTCDPSCGSRGGQCGGPACTGLPSFATYDCLGCCLPDQ
jgi:hypothetical protein